MNALIICVSTYYGNTRKLAEAMAPVLNADIIEPNAVKGDLLVNCDVIGFGSGIIFGKHDPKLFEFVRQLPKVEKKAFIFSTMGRTTHFQNSYHKPIREMLTEKGYMVIGEFSCRGFTDYYKIFKVFGGVNKGRPNAEDLRHAEEFAWIVKQKTDKPGS